MIRHLLSATALLVMLCGAAAGKRTQSVEALLANSRDPLIRESAAQVLGIRGSSTSVRLLVGCMTDDDNQWVRARCAEALGRIGDPPAIRPLASALAREKDQRVRRMIAQALTRLGQKDGINELMWQLKTGTNNTRAEVMALMVDLLGMPLGQDVAAWWAHLAARGNLFLARRPGGSPAIIQLGGLDGKGPLLHVPQGQRLWQVPAIVLNLGSGRGLITEKLLRSFERRGGPMPDGCLLLMRTERRRGNAQQPEKTSKKEQKTPSGPGLSIDAAQYLFDRLPNLVGVGIDLGTIDPPGSSEVRRLFLNRKKVVIEALGDLDRIPEKGARLLLLQPAWVLAILP